MPIDYTPNSVWIEASNDEWTEDFLAAISELELGRGTRLSYHEKQGYWLIFSTGLGNGEGSSGTLEPVADLTDQVDGITDTFTLPFTPDNPDTLLISLGGQVRRPTTDYTITDDQLVFTFVPSPAGHPLLVFNGVTGDAPGEGEGATTFAELTDKATVDLPTVNTPLADALGALVTSIALKAADSAVVKLTGNQTVAGIKTFSSSPIVPAPTTDFQASTKKYVDDTVAGGVAGVGSFNGRTGVVVPQAGDYDADDVGDGTTNKAYTAIEKTKLAGIATGATANSSDATLLARGNHTGTQAATTITEDGTHRFATDAEKTTWNAKVTGNTAITGATKTKVTYDSKGLVTSGADATTADIADSSNKRYVTDAQLTVVGNTSGTNTGDQSSVTGNAGSATVLQTSRNIDGQAFNGSADITVIAPGTHAATSKATPVDADELPLVDSAASNVLKRLTWANLKATVKTYFDTLYLTLTGGTLTGTLTVADVQLTENKSILLDAALSADGKWSGICETGTLGETVAFGETVYLKSDSKWWKTDADAEATSGPVMVRFCVLAGNANDPTLLLQSGGKIRADSQFPAGTVGAPAYLSGTAGAITLTPPSATDSVRRFAGYFKTADELIVEISTEYTVHT